MDPEQIIGQLIGGFLGGKARRSRGGIAGAALGLGGRGRGLPGTGIVNAGTLLTVGGLIWGALETMQQGQAAGGVGASTATPSLPGASGSASPGAPRASAPTPDLVVPPPLPPIPGATPASPQAAAASVPVPPALLPLVQLAVSAARADGELSDQEVAVISQRAAALGAGALVESELQQRRGLDTITPAFTTPEQRAMAYALAYAVVHGHGEVSPGERMYLTQLQRLLRLDHTEVERLERETLAGDTDAR